LKHLFTRQGWTAEHFLRELNARLGFDLDPGVEDSAPPDAYRDHVGIHAQKQPGLYYVGAAVLRGRITTAQMRAAANLAEKYAAGELRTTNMQNLLVINVPRENVETLVCELDGVGLRVEASPFWRGAVACTGTEFCKLAITETKSFARWLVEELEERVPDFDQPLKLNVTGCPNACGQHWIADIGLEGKKIKHGANFVDAYYFCVGGAVGEFARISRHIGFRCVADEVPEAIERLLKTYLATRDSNENLRAYFARHSDNELRTQLAGAIVAPVTRDLPAGPVPHGVGD
jgi:sulfite reductase (ferredoxin)